MRRLLALLTFTFVISVVYSQPQKWQGQGAKVGIIYGKVTDESTGDPMEYVNVAVFSKKDSSLVSGGITDAKGRYRIEQLPYGAYTVRYNFIGYDNMEFPDIRIIPKNPVVDMGEYIMKSSASLLEEAVVTAERTNVEYKIDKKVVNVSENLLSSAGNAVDILETVPSIQIDVEGNIQLRGSSSFTVLIDGKPTVLSPTDVLEQIPASDIQNIEIITNPSVKYDPDGTAGIINVVLKNKLRNGFSGEVNGTVGMNEKYNTNAIFSLQHKKWDFKSTVNWQDRTFRGENEYQRVSTESDTLNVLNSDGKSGFNREGLSLQVALGYRVNNRNKVTVETRIGEYGFNRSSRDFQNQEISPPGGVQYFDNSSIFERTGQYMNFNLTWDYEINPKHKIVTYALFSMSEGENQNNQVNIETDGDREVIPGGEQDLTLTIEDDVSDEFRIKSDYTGKIGEHGELEAGFQWRRDDETENFNFFERETGDEPWPEVPAFENSTIYTRNIVGGYGSYSGKLSFLNYKVGLRAEYTDRKLENVASDTVYVLDRLDWFPSVHLSHKFKKDAEVYTSYSRRINRPRGYWLDPFPYFRDRFNIRIGNPALEPEYITSVEAGFIKDIKKTSISVEGYYRQTNNKITRVQELSENNIIINTFDNLNRDYTIGGELSFNFLPTQWMTVNLSGNVFYYALEGEVVEDEVDQSSTNFDARLNISLKAGKNTRFQINGFYTSPTVTVQGERDGIFTMNLSARQDFFKRRFSATVQVRDIFNTNAYDYRTLGTGFETNGRSNRESGIVLLTLSYRINNYKPQRRGRPEGGGADYSNEY